MVSTLIFNAFQFFFSFYSLLYALAADEAHKQNEQKLPKENEREKKIWNEQTHTHVYLENIRNEIDNNNNSNKTREKNGCFCVVVGMRSDESCSLIGVYTEIHVNSFRKIFIAFAHKPLMPECQTNLLLAMFYSYIIFLRYFVFVFFVFSFLFFVVYRSMLVYSFVHFHFATHWYIYWCSYRIFATSLAFFVHGFYAVCSIWFRWQNAVFGFGEKYLWIF